MDTEGTVASHAKWEQISPIIYLAAFQNKNHFLLVTPFTRTGTGKTFASAFALRELKAKKALFIVHREQIAKQALKSYQKYSEIVSLLV